MSENPREDDGEQPSVRNSANSTASVATAKSSTTGESSKCLTLTSKRLLRRRRRSSNGFTEDSSMEVVCNKYDNRKVLIQQVSPTPVSKRRPLLLPGVKIAVPILPIRPDGPKQKSSRKRRKLRFQMATVRAQRAIGFLQDIRTAVCARLWRQPVDIPRRKQIVHRRAQAERLSRRACWRHVA